MTLTAEPGTPATTAPPRPPQPLRHRLAERGVDWTLLLILPAVLIIGALFVYPFLYGLSISFQPLEGGDPLANYTDFFGDPYLRDSIWKTLRLAVPVAVLSVAAAAPLAFRMRRDFPGRRIVTLVVLLPLTFGSVLIAQGMTQVFSPTGWTNLLLTSLGVPQQQFIYNYTGTFIATTLVSIPFAFVMLMGFFGGIDRSIEDAAATLGASRAARFWRIIMPLAVPGLITAFTLCLVEAFAVFPSAILVGQPDNATHVLTLPIYQAASQRSDYPAAAAIAVVMTVLELVILGVLMLLRNRLYRGPATGGKG
ncbi:ABC transporter permease [Pseudonocardia xinjiangensis]|uniref:Sugar ABC transporter permease n=1 Tax=Pseudonocardia xinjiangensis TaxID=75289 RepID=A0ABX1RIC5_9PSEU|nr:sugar ABC transporter permease [Pseudonocardia xinjiangensis]NMH78983.1 sugar ABC transporter permease [Pseudonocardia xinjiangensis]